ncbi:Uncharacterised protein [Chlamydia trachomatis]|nr:Uncharacterised protein [Chlamydia trachomatis]
MCCNSSLLALYFMMISQVSLALLRSLDNAMSKGTSLKALPASSAPSIPGVVNGVSHQPCILL